MQSFTLRPADWEDLSAFKHIARTTLTEDIPALFDPNKLLEDKKIGFEYIMAAEQNGRRRAGADPQRICHAILFDAR